MEINALDELIKAIEANKKLKKEETNYIISIAQIAYTLGRNDGNVQGQTMLAMLAQELKKGIDKKQ